jgi:hypothetical protein
MAFWRQVVNQGAPAAKKPANADVRDWTNPALSTLVVPRDAITDFLTHSGCGLAVIQYFAHARLPKIAHNRDLSAPTGFRVGSTGKSN